jgi:2-aminoadipate transaminase
LEAPPSIIARANLVKQAADLCTSPLAQLLVERFFTGDLWRRWVDESCVRYGERRNAMIAALEREFPEGSNWTTPHGGLFVWASIPSEVHTGDLLARALHENVAFVPGAGAFLDGTGTESMRLNFSASNPEQIAEGIRRIGRAIDSTLTLSRRLSEAVRAGEETKR